MNKIDNVKFGLFLLKLRQERGFTQKDIADKIGVSDKAVSKWERGLSFPDITLLDPLASIYEVTLSELYYGERITPDRKLELNEVNSIVTSTMEKVNDEQLILMKRRKKKYVIFWISIFLCFIQTIYLFGNNYLSNPFEGVSTLTNLTLTNIGIALVCNIYFTFFAKEKLPIYYDQNKINYYTDGIFRLHMVGLQFNNNNWYRIVSINCIILSLVLVVTPFIIYLYSAFQLISWEIVRFSLPLSLLLCIFIPTYIVAYKYK